MRSKELLQIALKRPMYTDNVDETEEDIKKARAGVIRAQQVKEAHEGDLGLHKHKSVEELLETGAWQGYMPSNLWPLASERAAASVVLKRWRQYKAKKAAAPSVGGGGLFSKAPAAKVEEIIVPLKKVAPDATPLPPMSEPKKDLQKVKTLTQEQIDAQNAREAAAEAEIKRIEDAKAPKDVKIEVAAAQAPAAVDTKETTSTAAGTPTKKKEEEPAKQKKPEESK